MKTLNNNIFFYCITLLMLYKPSMMAQDHDCLDINNISVRINATGDLFNDYKNAQSEFVAPKETGKTPMYVSCLWIGGFDDNDQLHCAAPTYRSLGSDTWEGPVADNYFPSYFAKYRKVFKVSKSEIDQFLETKNPSQSILDWPAHGDTLNGELFYLAPFVDVDQDGIYNPNNGDYPEIQGDQAIFYMFNDDRLYHSLSRGEKLGIEVHGLAYAFKSPSNEAIDNTVFIKLKIINRSENDYYNLYTGLFSDFDLGYYYDDYIGCDSANNFYYGYNGDNIDEGEHGYGKNPPTIGIIFLNQRLTSFIGFNSNSCAANNPTKPIEFYNNLKGLWYDGDPIHYGGNGYDNYWDNYTTKFLYSDPPFLALPNWSEKSAENQPGDRRALGSTGPFTLTQNSELYLDVAFVFSEADTQNSISSTEMLYSNVNLIKEFYDNSISSNQYFEKTGLQFEISPNPVISNTTIQFSENLNKEIKIIIIDELGKIIMQNNIPENSKDFAINLLDVKPGIYILKVQIENKTFSKIIVKQ